MQVEFIVNGGVSLLLVPENAAEEALVKQIMTQDNDLTEIRTRIMVLNKSFNNGILIGKRELGKKKDEKVIEPPVEDEGQL